MITRRGPESFAAQAGTGAWGASLQIANGPGRTVNSKRRMVRPIENVNPSWRKDLQNAVVGRKVFWQLDHVNRPRTNFTGMNARE
jgi:hypothetical protein